MAKIEAIKAGYDEAILLSPQGYVSECTGENLFIVRHGRIITPPLSAGALEGITQSSVMALARDLGIETEVGNLLRSDLYTAEEAYLTGTAAEVVRAIDEEAPRPHWRRPDSAMASQSASASTSTLTFSPPCASNTSRRRSASAGSVGKASMRQTSWSSSSSRME